MTLVTGLRKNHATRQAMTSDKKNVISSRLIIIDQSSVSATGDAAFWKHLHSRFETPELYSARGHVCSSGRLVVNWEVTQFAPPSHLVNQPRSDWIVPSLLRRAMFLAH